MKNITFSLPEGVYALRLYDKNDNVIFYASTRLGAIRCEKGKVIVAIPSDMKSASRFELVSLDTMKIVKQGNPFQFDQEEAAKEPPKEGKDKK